MAELKDLFQKADWKTEKHVPVIECGDSFKKNEVISINVMIGKEVPHPNTSAHHIVWIDIYFLPDGEKFPYQICRYEFSSHGASTQGPDTSSIYTPFDFTAKMITAKSGRILVSSYCNIHGLWSNERSISVS
jgi:superoxide reductase